MDGPLGHTLGISALMSVSSGHVAGIIGGLALTAFGPELGMAAAIWTGATTEPVFPDLAYPWWAWGIGVAMTISGTVLLTRESRTPTRPIAAMVLAIIGAVISGLLPFLQLVRLVQAASG